MANEQRITLTDAARQLGVHQATAWRWAKIGIEVGGRVCKLQYERKAGRLYTRPEWLDDFNRQCAEADQSQGGAA